MKLLSKEMKYSIFVFIIFLVSGCSPSASEKEEIAVLACNIMDESKLVDSVTRIKEINLARQEIDEPRFLGNDEQILKSIMWGMCKELVLNDPDYELKLKEKIKTFAAQQQQEQELNKKEMKVITFETTLGPIVIELFEEEAPITSKNFLEYAESGFFNGTLFHRVMPGFVIQGGGMESGMVDKRGKDPIQNEGNNGVKNLKWTLSMARTNEPHSASSQFFINLVNNSSLDHTEETMQGWGYAVFGEVVEGFETVEAIAAVATGNSGFHQNVPLEEISIVDTKVTTE